jgi:thiol-disulfide isomerase/thioredoxin
LPGTLAALRPVVFFDARVKQNTRMNASLSPQTPDTSPPPPLATCLVVCLCAAWCGVCRDYAARFAQVQAKYPQAQFLWVDVEDEADLLHPLDVEDFPTLLIATGQAPRFFGPITPQLEMLDRLVKAHLDNPNAPALGGPELGEVLRRLRAKKPAH